MIGLLMTFSQSSVAQPFHHPYGEWREYNQDWLAACPDTIDENADTFYGFSCFASTGSTVLNAANLPAYKLTLLLNRLTGALDIAFTAAATDDTDVDPTRPMQIKIGGETSISLDFTLDLEIRYNTANQYYVANRLQRDVLLAAMKARNTLTVSLPITGEKSDDRDIHFSLRGVTASLDFMASYARKLAQY
ncbi:hypothetical protein PSQ90_03425 [Devosia rhodophyticola]|uniref:Uncharacterized protein n=1 Tax=Devosia rhodophyticola TaxID=3026423 RepID=A0ABY7YYR7_9HYPH|nr:hypothetical protein [Devosia rhodophyticola]WDR06528.1 hypothetical protein PSQ90_03425 [Devosia rhodophyticola]